MTTSQDPQHQADGRRPLPRRLATRHLGIGAAALIVAAIVLAACGSASSAPTTSSSAPPTSSTPGATRGGGAAPGASGTIASVSGSSMEVQNPTTGQTTVDYSATTAFSQTVPGSAASLTVGSCISAFGTPASGSTSGGLSGPITATTVSITQPTSSGCTTGFGGRSFPGGGSGRPPGGGTRPGGARFGGGTRPGGGSFGRAFGSVTAVSGSTVTVSEKNPVTQKTSSVPVTLTASTTYTTPASASASDLAVGKCARATGTAGSTGAIAATSITISTPGANGCTSGFGAGRAGQGGPGGA
jgi:hypothetical protein